MARIRSIKPELRTSLTVAEWPREVRYFWVLLWGYLDDHGRGVDDARLVKADCFPLDDDLTRQCIDEWLDLIATAGPLCRYQVDGKRFIHVPSWTEHQKPSHPGSSRAPKCPLHDCPEGSPESLAKPSGVTPETFVPEQVVRAGSREQATRETRRAERTSGGSPEAKARGIVRELTDATEDEAAAIVARVRERKPKSLNGFLHRLGADGDLATMLADLRAETTKQLVARQFAEARAGPTCVHGEKGGANPHPTTSEPLCPQCRTSARLQALNHSARPA